MPTTEVILIENIPGLGAEADVVKVKAGYARNFLVPNAKAYEVTPATMKKLNALKAKRAEREARELNEAEELSRRINKLKLTFTLETGEGGKAFGSITAKDIADKLKTEFNGAEIDRHRIVLEHPIKNTGAHEIPIKLHADVASTLHINVKSASEAATQAEEAAGAESSAEKGGFKSKAKARHSAR
jgi:large subunit ribosomal protein L9